MRNIERQWNWPAAITGEIKIPTGTKTINLNDLPKELQTKKTYGIVIRMQSANEVLGTGSAAYIQRISRKGKPLLSRKDFAVGHLILKENSLEVFAMPLEHIGTDCDYVRPGQYMQLHEVKGFDKVESFLEFGTETVNTEERVVEITFVPEKC